ncbi:sulfatase family protein [Altererythrobacter sp.]|uniref:sulfatase family protein n=1 Tax=Altererythrobacter sp. TaxID=1872480 RepID=UPI003D10AD59
MKTARRTFIQGMAATGALSGYRASAASSPRPNILVILADDMGWADLGCFGSRHIRTPHLDRLAAAGVRMTDCYASSPVCSPTRLSMATGRYNVAFRTGLIEPFSAGEWGDSAIPEGYPTLPALLREAGYGTSLIGKWHLGESEGGSPLAHGYDEFYGFLGGAIDYFTHQWRGEYALHRGEEKSEDFGYMTTLLANETVKALARYNESEKPFLISLHFNAPHWPWEGPEDQALGGDGGSSIASGGSLETYAQMMESLDRNIGRVLRALDDLGMADDTLVIFTSDNGGERFSEVWPFTGMKGMLLEGGIRVPGIVRFPGRIPAGVDSAQMASTMDWMPTILDAAGVKPRQDQVLDGISLLPPLASGRSINRSLFWKFQGHNQRAARVGNWKYLKLDDNEFLFDLSVDSLERADMAKSEPERFDQLKAAWEEWNKGMVTDDSIAGFCHSPGTLAGMMPDGEEYNCKVYGPRPEAPNPET